jgi:hypothetical protein
VDLVDLLLVDDPALGDGGVDQQVNHQIPAENEPGQGMKPSEHEVLPASQ